MMSVIELLSRLRSLDVKIELDGDRIGINAPKGALTPELRDELKARKAELLEYLKSISVSDSSAPSMARQEGAGPFPLTYAQKRFWVLEQMGAGEGTYNIPLVLRLRGALDVAALTKSLQIIIERHEILRTTYLAVDGIPYQIVEQNGSFDLPVLDLSGAPDVKSEVETLIGEEAKAAFDLSDEWPIRVTLLRIDDDEHILLVTMHHIASDAWSFTVFQRELHALYSHFVTHGVMADPEDVLSPLPIRYVDYAVWQDPYLQTEEASSQLAYWRRQLQGAPSEQYIATDSGRKSTRTFHGAQLQRSLEPELSERLRALCRREGVTLFMLLLAALKILLHRYSGQDDILVGTPVAGRNRPRVENLIGLFLNTLVLRTDLSDRATFAQLLAEVREASLSAYANQDTPFELILEELKISRDVNSTPLFQVFFNVINVGSQQVKLGDLAVETMVHPGLDAKFDLTVYVVEEEDQIELYFVYNRDRFAQTRMAEMANQYVGLLEQVVTNPELPIDRFSLVTEEASRVLPDPTAPLDETWPGPVHKMLSRHASEMPGKLAITDDDDCWTYGELESRCNQLAHYLIASGVGPQDVVAVYGRRSASLIWAILGILKAGAAYLILDPQYPAQRLKSYLELAKPHSLLPVDNAEKLDREVERFLGQSACKRLVTLPSLAEATSADFLDEYPRTAPGLTVGPNDLACLTFTSGSTGMPKGVMGRHSSLTNFIPWTAEHFGLGEGERFSMLSGLAHDALQRDVLFALWLGATICIPDPRNIGLPNYLSRWFAEQRITVANLTPAMARLLTDSTTDADGLTVTIPCLTHAFLVGEVLTQHVVGRLQALFPNVTVINLYGTTENQQANSYYQVSASFSEEEVVGKAIPLGKGLKDVQLLLLNSANQLAGIGEIAEICFRSPHIALGYLDDEVLTQRRFVANPFRPNAENDRLYRTGDLGRYLPDGQVAFVDRSDQQVNIRGYRIEVAEVEALLSAHRAVRQAVVMAREDVAGDKRLVAYIVSDGDHGAYSNGSSVLSASSLRNFMLEQVPSYMAPSAYVIVDNIPLNPNGKVDYKGLPAPDISQMLSSDEYVAPRTAVESTVASIWADVLNTQRVGVEDDFFELGGHSLIATQVVARIRDAFGVEMPIHQLFETSTVSKLSGVIEQSKEKDQDKGAVQTIELVDRTEPIPLSFAQERLWFIHQMQPDMTAYNVVWASRVKGELNVAALEASINGVIDRHETLRTRYVSDMGAPTPVIDSEFSLRLNATTLAHVAPEQRETELESRINAFAQEPFDLENEPVIRARLFQLAPQDYVLVVVTHHIAVDAWSSFVFAREVAALYQAFVQERENPLPPLPIQYVDFAGWQRRALENGLWKEQLEYWRKKMEGVEVLDLPTDYQRPPLQTYNGALTYLEASQSLFERLHMFSKAENVTTVMTFMAAFHILLYRYTNQTDITIGVPIANRRLTSVENLIGVFLNMLPIRVQWDEEPSFRQLLALVQQAMVEAYERQDYPFEKLVAELQPTRDLAHSPLFQVMLDYINVPTPSTVIGGLEAQPFPLEHRTAKFDITLNIVDITQKRTIGVEYNTDLFEASTIERMLEHFRALLESILENPDLPISHLSMLPQRERQQLLADWNQTQMGYARESCIHHLIEAQVAQTPDKTAVRFDGDSLTYRQLDALANQVALRLQQLGVGPDVIVGICLERSLEMLVSLLGVMKSGGAYMPLDPSYPIDRLAYMVKDSECSVLILASSLDLSQQLISDLPMAPHVLFIDEEVDMASPDEALERDLNVTSAVTAQDLAYVIYTSGSTGLPKGVRIPHQAVVNFLLSMQQKPGLSGEDSLLSVTTLSFDIAVLELYLPLISGAEVQIVRQEVANDGQLLAEALRKSDATVMQATPVTWRMLIDAGWEGDPALKILCGGEALAPDLAEELLERCWQLWNMYGPTETTVWSTTRQITSASERITIGRPIANTRIYILDNQMQPAPIGITGELYIGGDGVACGYHDRRELTAEKFLPDPFVPGARIYHTGDLARYYPNGEIDFLGRKDYQIKIRGFRVELGEIETALAGHGAVHDVVVMAREDQPGDKRLVAYMISDKEKAQPSDSELRDHVGRILPAYMVPSHFVFMDSFPKTPNNKVNRKALPAPQLNRDGLQHDFVAPRNETERVIASIMGDLLNVGEVGVFDSFFEMGGHSLLAARLVSRIRNELESEISLPDLFEAPSTAELALRLDKRQETGGAVDGDGAKLAQKLRLLESF